MILNMLLRYVNGVDFYRDSLEGQMTVSERKKLFELVRTVKPRQVFEIGTWKGGGSTYILSSALRKNKKGRLYTVELFPEFYNHAIKLYEAKLSYLRSYVDFHLGNSIEIYTPIIASIEKVDFLFLDGAEDDNQTVEEFELFRPKLLSGSVVALHDWKTKKMGKMRPLMENQREWYPLVELSEGPTGFAAFRKV